MAKITPVLVTEAVTTHTFAATASGGDEIQPLGNREMIILFNNTAVGAVTATISPNTTSGNDPSLGAWTKGDLTQSIPASATRAIHISQAIMSNYLDSNGEIPITYSSHDVDLLVSVLQHG